MDRLFGVPVGTLAVVLTFVLAAAFGLVAAAAECLAAALDEPLALSGAPGRRTERRPA